MVDKIITAEMFEPSFTLVHVSLSSSFPQPIMAIMLHSKIPVKYNMIQFLSLQ